MDHRLKQSGRNAKVEKGGGWNYNDYESERLRRRLGKQLPKQQQKEVKAYRDLPFDKDRFEAICQFVWIVVFAGFAAVTVFWIPDMIPKSGFFTGINFTAISENVIGALIASIVTHFEQVKFQYFQTYLMYGAIKGGFCSVFTTFGNMIEDTDRLLYYGHAYTSPINLFGTVGIAFLLWQLGRVLSNRWKEGTRFSQALMMMENEDNRIHYETDRLVNDELTEESGGTFRQLVDQGKQQPNSPAVQVFSRSHGSMPSDVFDAHVQIQFAKRRRHVSPWFQNRHYLVFFGMIFAIIANTFFVLKAPKSMWPGLCKSSKDVLYTWFVSLGHSVVGALCGNYLGEYNRKHGVYWGTFRVNILSCVLIATAHNILMFRHFFVVGGRHIGDSTYFAIFWVRFIHDFCGSESSFAGLIDETSTLWFTEGVPKRVAVRNLIYNLLTGQSLFLVFVYLVRFLTFFR